MQLSNAQRTFILHWGEMGSSWGINRATAQVHALLLASEDAIHAQDISEALQLARSNVSTALKELQSWSLIKLTHVMGDRREHFEADKDAWSVFAKIADRRLEREIIPTINMLKELHAKQSSSQTSFTKLLGDFTDLLETGVGFYRRVRGLPLGIARKLLKFERSFERLLFGGGK